MFRVKSFITLLFDNNEIEVTAGKSKTEREVHEEPRGNGCVYQRGLITCMWVYWFL